MEEHKHSRTSRRRRGLELYLTAKKRSITTWNRLSYTRDIALWPFIVLTFVIRAQAVTLFKDFAEVM